MKNVSFICFVFIFAMFSRSQIFAYEYDFAVCAIFQNEAPYLKEWIEFHKIVGAEHFYLYNNESQDNFLEVLNPYIEEGIVEVVDWHEPDFQFSGQKKSYMDAINKTRGKVKWLAILDIDEYLVPKTYESIPAFLSEFDLDEIGGVGINWQMFGTSFVSHLEGDDLLTEKLILKAPRDYHENLHVKSIVRPEYVIEPPHVHYFEYVEGRKQVNALHETFQKSRTEYVNIDKIQINHYWSKDEYFFNEVKVPRRLKFGDSIETINLRITNLNQFPDYSIQRFIPTLKREMGKSQLKSF